MRSMVIRLNLGDPAETALMRLAIRERRDPRHQAEVLVIDGLRQRGLVAVAEREPAPLLKEKPSEDSAQRSLHRAS